MPRSKTILQSEFPYHVTARCINKEWFNLPMECVWEIMSQQLFFIHHAFGAEILAFVLMSNHFHLLLRTPLANLDKITEWFMRESSRSLVWEGNRINQTYGGPHFRCVVSSFHHFLNAYKYLYFNPVHAGICRNVEDYRFSSLRGLLGQERLLFPVANDETLFSDVEGTLRWLNSMPTPDNWAATEKALKRREFKLARLNNRPHPLEVQML